MCKWLSFVQLESGNVTKAGDADSKYIRSRFNRVKQAFEMLQVTIMYVSMCKYKVRETLHSLNELVG